jgi:hypothetical protein
LVLRREALTVRSEVWRRLEFAHDLWLSLEANEGRDVARRWFVGENARLRGDTPVMAIRVNRRLEAQVAAESFIRDDVDE